jgi:hypothetical protein
MPTPTQSPQGGLQDEEITLEPELENAPEPDDEEPVDDLEDEVEEVPEVHTESRSQESRQEMVPLERLSVEKARGDILQRALETLQHNAQQTQQARPAVVEDLEANLTPEDKKWREYIRQAARPEIERRVQEVVSQIKQQSLDPLQRVSIEVQDRIDEQETKRQFRDYDTLRDDVNRTRAEWYQRYGVVAPRDVAYHYVKGQMLSKSAGTTRTANARANAKQTATVPNKHPSKKIAPKGPVTLNDVAHMSSEDAERWLIQSGTKF